jgi:4-carboxymuconolactone decarboxylase
MKLLKDRMPPMSDDQMDAVQRAAAAELIAGPRKGVKGPFIPLLRSPDLMARLQKVGEYLRFESALPPRTSEFATLVVARHWSQQFEWFTHVPLALKAGTQQTTIDELGDGARPAGMSTEEALVYDFACELALNRGVCDETYRRAVEAFGERGVIDLVGIIGYFTWISMVLNVAHTPPEPASAIAALCPVPR